MLSKNQNRINSRFVHRRRKRWKRNLRSAYEKRIHNWQLLCIMRTRQRTSVDSIIPFADIHIPPYVRACAWVWYIGVYVLFYFHCSTNAAGYVLRDDDDDGAKCICIKKFINAIASSHSSHPRPPQHSKEELVMKILTHKSRLTLR